MGEAASQRSSTREGGRDRGGRGLGPGWAAAQVQGSACLTRVTTQYVRPVLSVCAFLSFCGPLWSSVLHVCCMVAQTNQHQLSNQTTYCRYQLTLLLPQSILQRLVHSLMAWARVALPCGLKVVSHKSVTRAPAHARARPSHHTSPRPHRHSTILNLSVGQSVSQSVSKHQSSNTHSYTPRSDRVPDSRRHFPTQLRRHNSLGRDETQVPGIAVSFWMFQK